MNNYNETLEQRRDRKDDQYASQKNYREELQKQILANKSIRDRIKEEDNVPGILTKGMESCFKRHENEAQAKLEKNIQYSKDLKLQIDGNERRKQKDMELKSNEIWDNDLFSGMNEDRSEFEKKKKQMETKEALDEIIKEKLKLGELQEDEEKKYQKEMQELFENYKKEEMETKQLQKEKSFKLQQDFQEFSKAIKSEISRHENEIQAAANKEGYERSSQDDVKVDDLRKAQNKLRDDTCKGWDEQINIQKHKREEQKSQMKDEMQENMVWNDRLNREEELRRETKMEQNKQYQRDLMEQIKSDQRKKFF